jgi:succinyl-CoA synthetase alpha subunit
MAILVNRQTRLVVHGLTGRYASLQVAMMRRYGTQIIAGVSPGRGGERLLEIPLFDSVGEAQAETTADAAMIYVPAPLVLEAFYELMDHGIKTIFIGTEGVPVHDSLMIRRLAEQNGCWVIGPNSLGILCPGQILMGSLDPGIGQPGSLGLMSRSGTLSLLVMSILNQAGFGFSTAVSIGGDLISGRSQADYLRQFENDPHTRQIVMLTEIGGSMEYAAADQIRTLTKPVVCYIVGWQAPDKTTMGHSGARIRHRLESAEAKMQALTDAGAKVVRTPWEIPPALTQTPNAEMTAEV